MSERRRLTGWKSIAAYLDVSVRTAHRWANEGNDRLPVHRVRGTVFAETDELQAWLAKSRQSDAVPAPRTPSPYLGTIGVLAMLATGVVFALLWGSTVWVRGAGSEACLDGFGPAFGKHREEPAVFRVCGSRVELFSHNREFLWGHDFDIRLEEGAYDHPRDINPMRVGEFADIDGDGSWEFLFVLHNLEDRSSQALFVFKDDGSPYFPNMSHGYRTTASATFGTEQYLPPFIARRVVVTEERDGSPAIWLASSHKWEPTVIEKLTPELTPVARYWHWGHIETLLPVEIEGRRLLLIGGYNNDFGAAVLSVIDRDNPEDSSPLRDGGKACTECAGTGLLGYFVFPKLDLWTALAVLPTVNEITAPAGESRIEVRLGDVGDVLGVGRTAFAVHYGFDESFRLVHASFDDDFWRTHARAQVAGVVEDTAEDHAIDDLLPVLSWEGGEFVPMRVLEAVSSQVSDVGMKLR